MASRKIVVTGAAGLVGQNLIPRLEQRNFGEIVAIDKHPSNTETLRRLHPNLRVIHRATIVISVPLKNCRTTIPAIMPAIKTRGDL